MQVQTPVYATKRVLHTSICAQHAGRIPLPGRRRLTGTGAFLARLVRRPRSTAKWAVKGAWTTQKQYCTLQNRSVVHCHLVSTWSATVQCQKQLFGRLSSAETRTVRSIQHLRLASTDCASGASQQRVTDTQRVAQHRAGPNTEQTKRTRQRHSHAERVWQERAPTQPDTAGRLLLFLQKGEPRSKEEKQKREKMSRPQKSASTTKQNETQSCTESTMATTTTTTTMATTTASPSVSRWEVAAPTTNNERRPENAHRQTANEQARAMHEQRWTVDGDGRRTTMQDQR